MDIVPFVNFGFWEDFYIDLFNNQLHEWDSIQDAVVGTCTNRTSINYVLKGKRNQAGGYKWTYSNIY